MYRSYTANNNIPQPINSAKNEPKSSYEHKKRLPEKKKSTLPFISNLNTDDIILLIVIAMLIFNDCDDKLLLLALIYIFFSDFMSR